MTVSASDFAVPEEFVTRWDREWLKYLKTEDVAPHLVAAHELQLVSDLRGASAREVYDGVVATHSAYVHPRPLHVWAPIEALAGKDVLEAGCGTGFLGRQLSFISRSYLGVDASRLAVAIARGCAAANNTFVHLNDTPGLAAAAGSRDCMVGREFFIHQNFSDAVRLLRLARFLLRPGGRVYADFFMRTQKTDGIVHSAITDRDRNEPSAGFSYRPRDIAELARLTMFAVIEETEAPDLMRRFVTFEVLPA